MAIAYVSVGTADNGSTSCTPAFPASIAAGDLLILGVANKYPTNGPDTPSGWVAATNYRATGGHGSAGADAGDVYISVYLRIADGTETGTVTVTCTSGNSMVARIARLTKAAGKLWEWALTNGQEITPAATWSVTMGSDPGVIGGDFIFVWSATNEDTVATGSAPALTITGITMGAEAERSESSTITGDDCTLYGSSHAITSGTSSAAAVYTFTNSTSTTDAPAGASVLIRLREVDIAPSSIATEESLGSHTVSVGAGGITIDLNTGGHGLGSGYSSGTASVGIGINASGIATAEAFGTATIAVSGGAIELLPSGIDTAEAFGTAIVSSPQIIYTSPAIMQLIAPTPSLGATVIYTEPAVMRLTAVTPSYTGGISLANPTVTLDALKNDPGVRVALVLSIEGYEYVFTNGPVDGCATIYTNPPMTYLGALGGLDVSGEMSQSIDPWSPGLDPVEAQFIINPQWFDTSDTDEAQKDLGLVVHRQGSGAKTQLTDAMSPGVVYPFTTVNVQSTSAFDSSGTVHIGCERMAYASKGATSFSVSRGTCSPVGTDVDATTYRWARRHSLPEVEDGVQRYPDATSQQRQWAGRWVVLRAHHVNGSGVYNSIANSLTLFAGKIRDVRDSSTGATVLACSDARETLRDTVLMRNQFVGSAREGVYIPADGAELITVKQHYYTGTFSSPVQHIKQANAFTTADLAGAAYYTASDFALTLNAFLAAEVTAGRLASHTSFWMSGTDQGAPWRWRWVTAGIAGCISGVLFVTGPGWLLRFLGFDVEDTAPSTTISDGDNDAGGLAIVTITAAAAPYRKLTLSTSQSKLELDSKTQGEWVSLANVGGGIGLPEPYKSRAEELSPDDDWGFVRIADGPVRMVRRVSDTEFWFGDIDSSGMQNLSVAFGSSEKRTEGVRYGEDGDLQITQVLAMQGPFAEIVSRICHTTEGANYNGGNDDLSHQLGAAIPASILGAAFDSSLEALGESSSPATVILHKPTPFAEALGGELLLRRATLVFKEGAYRFATFSAPVTDASVLLLSESNKATDPAANDPNYQPSETSSRFLRNVVKVDYNLDSGGKYRNTVTLSHRESVDSYGETKPVTIKVAGAIGGFNGGGDTVSTLAADLAANVLAVFGKPVRIMSRSTSPAAWHLAPGDVVTLTDSFARDPDTGVRGLTQRPALVVESSYPLDLGLGGGPIGKVSLVFYEQTGTTTPLYSPAAFLETYTSGDPSLTIDPQIFSPQVDSASAYLDSDINYFQAGDEIQIIELWSPFTTHTATVASVNTSTNKLYLTGTVSGLDPDAVAVVVAQKYSDAGTSQHDAGTFSASEGDGLVEGLREAYTYAPLQFVSGEGASTSPTYATAIAAPPYPWYGDSFTVEGAPVNPFWVSNAMAYADCLVAAVLAQHSPLLFYPTLEVSGGVEDEYTVIHCERMYTPKPAMAAGAGTNRYLYIAPRLAAICSGGYTAAVRVSISDGPPTTTAAATGARSFEGSASESNTWTTTSTTPVNGDAYGFALPGELYWLTVEAIDTASCDPESGTSGTYCYGLPTFYLSPPE